MARECVVIGGRLTLETFVYEVLIRTGHRCFFIGKSGRISGLITAHEIKKVERNRRQFLIVADVMRPIAELHTITPDAPITEALEVMGREDLNQLPVTRDGHLEGVVSRANVLRLLQNRAEFQI